MVVLWASKRANAGNYEPAGLLISASNGYLSERARVVLFAADVVIVRRSCVNTKLEPNTTLDHHQRACAASN